MMLGFKSGWFFLRKAIDSLSISITFSSRCSSFQNSSGEYSRSRPYFEHAIRCVVSRD